MFDDNVAILSIFQVLTFNCINYKKCYFYHRQFVMSNNQYDRKPFAFANLNLFNVNRNTSSLFTQKRRGIFSNAPSDDVENAKKRKSIDRSNETENTPIQ
jgi:hypothetical protein